MFNKDYQQRLSTKVWWKVKKLFFNTYKCFNYDNNKFLLLLQKCFYSYEDMDALKKFDQR